MNVMTAIKGRRSIRKFTGEPVSKETLLQLVEAAVWAPTGSNAQTWRFIVITEKTGLKKVKMVSPGLGGYPSAVIVIAQDIELSARKVGKMGEKLSQMDSAMAAQNIMLAAYAVGLGTCVVASFHAKALAKVLQLPDPIQPQLLVSIGNTGREPRAPARKLKEITWWEAYDG